MLPGMPDTSYPVCGWISAGLMQHIGGISSKTTAVAIAYLQHTGYNIGNEFVAYKTIICRCCTL